MLRRTSVHSQILFPLTLTALTALPLKATAAPPATATDFILRANEGTIQLVIRDPAAPKGPRDHIIESNQVSGRIRLDPVNFNDCFMNFVVPVSTLVLDQPASRQKHGLGGPIDPPTKARLEAELRSPAGLATAPNAVISFESSSCAESNPKAGTAFMLGTLGVHGAAKPARIPMKFRVFANGKQVSADGAVEIRASDFGIAPNSGPFTGGHAGEDIQLVISVRGFAG
jgi:polyisoprenoid-binding protein YceI